MSVEVSGRDGLLERARALEEEAARLRAQAGDGGAAQDGAAPGGHQQAILERTTQFAIIGLDRDGRVTEWNAGAERILGWSADAIRGRPVELLFTPEDRAVGRAETEMRRALAEGRAEDERWHMCEDGSRFWASGEMLPLRDGQGTHVGYVKVLSDRSAAHRTDDALLVAEALLRRAQEAGGVGLFSVGIDDGMLHPSPEFCRLYGVPERPAYPSTVFETLVLPDDARLVSTAESRRRGEPPRDVEYRIRRPDTGEIRWIARKGEIERDAEGRPIRFSGIARDVTERRKSGDALARSEARYRALFEAIDDGFCIIEFIDGPHGPLSDYVHVEANPGYERHTGIPDIVGQKVRDMAAAEADGWVELYGSVLATGQPLRFERSFTTVGRHIEVSAARVEPPSRRQVSVLFRDITERKRAEAALRESEEQFRILAQTIPNQVWAAKPDGRLHWFNAQAHGYVGPALQEVDDFAAWGRVVHPDDLQAAAAGWSRAVRTGSVYEVEFRIRRSDGAYRWFLVRGEPVRDAQGAISGWVGTNTDIDERRRHAADLERQVAERTADRNALWQLSRDLMLRASFEGIITAVNPAWSETLGWRGDELVGRSLFDFIHPDDLARTIDGASELSQGTSHARFDNRYRCRDGSYRWIAWSTRPSEGVINAVGRDVTSEREQADALAQTEEALRQAQKMEAVGQLTGGLAHDFNNMLAGIVGSLELMQTRMAQGRLTEIDRYVTAAQGAAKRATALTHRLLAFSRRQTLDPKPTDVNRLVEGMEDLVRRSVGPGVTVEVVGAGGLWSTLVDPGQLENALLNLCINARDAMPAGGRIVVETGNRWLDMRAARERDLEPGQYVSLCVSDNGTGMSPDVIAKAFDPFFTTKPIGEGTGLGLSMIYGFAKQSGGQVRIYSELGQGTMVCLYLPRHLGEAEEPEIDLELSSDARAKAGETVLVVDDEPTVRMLVTEVLEDLGYAAIEAADAASGLKVLQSDVRIDLLVTDVGLPGGINGRQMADAARISRPDLKVLFITGYAENAALNHGHLAHGMNVMTKPFAMEALANRIRGLIEGEDRGGRG